MARLGSTALALLLFAARTSFVTAADVDLDSLRPGLVTTFRDGDGTQIVRLEPTIALGLRSGEASHPRLSAVAGAIQWQGYVNILRAGSFRFSARLRGRLRLSVGDKEMLVAESAGEQPALKSGPDIHLEAGAQVLRAEFTRVPGVAVVELFWESPHFRREPLPFDHLFHLPTQAPAQLAADVASERGRFLAEENNCVRCHLPAEGDRLGKGLHTRQAPDLSRIGERAFGNWIDHWLADAKQVRPEATMPRLFAADANGQHERNAVAAYLTSLGGPLKPQGETRRRAKEEAAGTLRGQRLFSSTGCIACHGPAPGRLGSLGTKTTPQKLAAYLMNPLAIDPSGRMPHMRLLQEEALDLARYLCQGRDETIRSELPAAAGIGSEELRAQGKQLLTAKGCTNCHTIAPGGKELPRVVSRFTLEQIRLNPAGGCLSDKPGSASPQFAFSEPDRKALRTFLNAGLRGAGSPAPTYEARATMVRFNCQACHSRDGAGGLTPDVLVDLRRVERAENAEAISPPPLTAAGHKLRTAWLRSVLLDGGRARPWMGLRMPQFGAANVGHLPEGLAALEGSEPDDRAHEVAMTTAKVETGRHLVGKNAFGCISCHDIAGVANHGTRGPDLALMNQRVRYDWYRNWLEQPQRMQPGTRMPQVFPDGKSTLPGILRGDADAQSDAMWAYLSLGMTMPLPEGLEPPKGLILTAKERPSMLRTFLPDAGSRAIAIGYPDGVSLAFDAATCRLAYAWSGQFLDASPVWNNRGGAPAKVLGTRFWTAPPGVPWAVTDSQEPPDFTALARDPAFGAALPEGTVFHGTNLLSFRGYLTDQTGRPTFQYRVKSADVAERPEPLRVAAGVGVARHFTVTAPAGEFAWHLVAESKLPPSLLDKSGMVLPMGLPSGFDALPAVGRMLRVVLDGERSVVLSAVAAPEDCRWYLSQQGEKWRLLLFVPGGTPNPSRLTLRIWSPYRDDPGFIKELAAVK